MVLLHILRAIAEPGPRSNRRNALAIKFAALFALATGAASPGGVDAHAAFDRSQPAPGAIVSTAPPQIHIWFTEPLEAARSGAEVLDQTGNPVDGATTRVAEGDDYQLVVSLPAGLANGLPTGMMIIGKRFDDATVLRVAQAHERAVGGFPAPPARTG